MTLLQITENGFDLATTITTIGSVLVSLLTIYLKHKSDTDKADEKFQSALSAKLLEHKKLTAKDLEVLRGTLTAQEKEKQELRDQLAERDQQLAVLKVRFDGITAQLVQAEIEPLFKLDSDV